MSSRFNEWLRFNVTNSATNFSDNYIGISLFADIINESFDFDEFVKSVVNLETNYNEPIEEDGKSSEEFKRIYTAISLYTTFVLDEPIHPVGTMFPGHLEVEYHDGVYYCPVKKNNEDNPRAVCQFCIAEQLEYD